MPGDAFWMQATVEQLAKEQGVTVPQPVDELIGQGADLWDSNDDFESFLVGLREHRTSSESDDRTSR